MSASLEKLIAALSNTSIYQPMSDAEIREEANRRYQSVYDEKRLSARQAYDTSDAALVRELAGVQTAYDKQRAQSKAEYEGAYRQADRQSLSRGMQRSTYNNATLSNITLAGNAAQQAISDEQAAKESDISQKRTNLSNQLGQLLKQYDASQLSDTLSYADELAAREHDRHVESTNTYNQLAMQLYEYQHELEQEALEQARWQAEFNAKYGSSSKPSRTGGSSGGGGSGGGKPSR